MSCCPWAFKGKRIFWWSHPCPRVLPINGALHLGKPGVLLSTHSVATAQPLQAISTQSVLSLSLGLTSVAWASAPSPYPCQQSISVWGVEGFNADLLCRLPFICLPWSGCRALPQDSKVPPLSSLISPLVRRLPWVQEHFLLHSSLPEVQAPSCSFFSSPFCPIRLYGGFLVFSEPKVFCWCSVVVLCESFHL